MRPATLAWALIAFPFIAIPSVRAAENDGRPLQNERTRSAIAVWQEYRNALQAGDEQRARACWTEAAQRYHAFDFNWRFDQGVASARQDSMEIADVKDCGKYVVLHVASPHWRETTWSGPPGRTWYAISAGSKALLANPVEVLTDGWQKRKTPHFVLHYPRKGQLSDRQAARMEEFYRETSTSLGIGLDRRVDYYMCDSVKTVGALLASGPAAGRAGIEDWIVAALGWTSFHEVVHVLLGQTCRKQPDSPILEGAACYFGGAGLITRDTQLAWAQTLMETGEAMPLATLLDEGGFWSAEDMNDPYAEAAAFTGFLIDRYGFGAYKSLYRFRDGPDTLEAAIEKISGKEVPRLETEWKKWLRKLDLPTIGLGIDERATEIFRMEDPANDDNGDGHFVYPLAQQYRPGMFDLTGFRVLSDEKRLYFELTYRDLVERLDGTEGVDSTGRADSTGRLDSTGWGFGGTFTRIAIDRGGPGEEGPFNFGWSSKATLAGHWDTLIDVGDCGVEMVEGGRIAACLKRVPSGERLGDAPQNRIRFSIPCSEPEASRKHWRYAVIVGGCGECGKHFRDWVGEFLPVHEHASEESGGGGSADSTNPNIYDVLLPAGQDQAQMLARRPVVVPMVGE
jgi:hypothetical protein